MSPRAPNRWTTLMNPTVAALGPQPAILSNMIISPFVNFYSKPKLGRAYQQSTGGFIFTGANGLVLWVREFGTNGLLRIGEVC
jgi:hypothetical protein